MLLLIYAGCNRWVEKDAWAMLMRSPNDSMFCRSACFIYWTPEQLKCRSVTGVLSNKYRSLGQTQAKPAMTAEKLNALKGLHSFSIVEEKAFKDLVEHLAPGRKTLTRRMLTDRLDACFEDMKQKLPLEFINVDHVAVSADLWSSFHRSFIGIVALWLDPSTLERKTAALAFRRVIGHATYDKLAEVLSSVFAEYGIQGKVTSVVTDNGSNFVKAFRVFGESETNETDDESEMRPADLTGILNTPDGSECVLPPHIRCAAHTLNLVATSDSAAAELDAQYSRVAKSVFKKCSALWSKQGQSNISADLIKSHCGVYLRRPVPTRWNSLHDAMEHLLKLHNEGKDIERLFCILKLPVLHRPAEYKFMEEYCSVMKPLSCALDVLQRQEHMFIGYLLPTLAVLEKRIKYEAMKGLSYCGPLASAVLDGIEKSSMRDQATMNVRTELAAVTQPARADVAASSAPEDFFSFGLQTLPAETQDELSRYLLVPGDYPLRRMPRQLAIRAREAAYNRNT
ncbi:hypothetical protein HPB52_000920 [Rhipicephalus sanguineus]|uniref:Uncharacterized protein n=1 Tax=Rhipicephalus sanguineus TaxID=34632 RepID=A0A9D4PTI5_RHISA|nr:hypothetical protein HPB52_000920 [Rhipicephalus sanguineus]